MFEQLTDEQLLTNYGEFCKRIGMGFEQDQEGVKGMCLQNRLKFREAILQRLSSLREKINDMEQIALERGERDE